MHATLRLNHAAYLPDSKRKCRIFKRLLHLPGTKPAQVTIVIVRGTIRVLASQLPKPICVRPDLCLVSPQDCNGVLLGTRDIRLLDKRDEVNVGGLMRRLMEVGLASFQLEGRREPLCLTKM